MPIGADKLIAAVAKACELSADLVQLYWRHLREAGEVPVGRSGRRGHEAEVDSEHAATLIAALLASESARGGPAAIKHVRALRAPRVFAPYARHDHRTSTGVERTVLEVTISPDAGTLEDAIAAHIDLYRLPGSALGDNFGPISMFSASAELWASIDIAYNRSRGGKVPFPGEPSYNSAVVFADPSSAGPEAHINNPAYLRPAPFLRSSSVTGAAIARIGSALGTLTDDEFEQRAFPIFSKATYSKNLPGATHSRDEISS